MDDAEKASLLVAPRVGIRDGAGSFGHDEGQDGPRQRCSPKHPLVQGQGPNVLAGDEEASLRPARIEHLGDVALGQVRGAPGCLNDICSGTERGETEHHLLLEASGSGPGSQVARADLCVTEPFE